MIKIDFHAGTHGHFLEYVSNVYIMQTSPNQHNIFRPPTYSAHNLDTQYLHNRQIFCGHLIMAAFINLLNISIFYNSTLILVGVPPDS